MRKGISTVMSICITIVIMLALAAGAWYYLDAQYDQVNKDQQAEITQLQKKLADLQKSSNSSNSSGSSTSSNTDTKSSTLATYISTKYGYSFQYPKTFSLVDWLWDGQRIPQEGKIVWVSPSSLSENSIPVDADPISQYLSFSVSDQLCGLSQLKGDGTAVEDVKFLGLDAWKTNVTDTTKTMGGQLETGYHVNKGSFCYNITWVNTDAAGTHPKEVDDIVASFQLK